MSTVAQDLDWLQGRLPNTDVWPRAELLGWYQDGYRELLSRSRAVRRIRPLDLPGRHTYALTQDWEDRYTSGGTLRKPSRSAAAGFYQASGMWEVELIWGVTPTEALAGYTQEWERAHISGSVDHHFRFMFPKDHERVVYLSWKDRALTPVSVRELDTTDTNWMAQIGEPRWWTTGMGRIRTVEVYEVSTTYQQGYAHTLEGLPRHLSGDRTYTPETHRNVDNAWAYTTAGDAQALTHPGVRHDPATAYTHSWESAYGQQPRFNFTVNLTMNYPGLEHTAVHPWEVSITGGPWIDADAPSLLNDILIYPESDPPITINGIVRSIAVDGDTGFGTAGAYTWEEAFGADAFEIATGGIRSVTSPNRQYLPVDADAQPVSLSGRVAEWRSSESAVMAIEVISASQALTEADVPALIPRQMQKYLRFYVLGRAFSRVGEGHNPMLADHFGKRFLAGVAFFKRFTDLAKADRVFTRETAEMAPSMTPPRVRLPSNFPSVT